MGNTNSFEEVKLKKLTKYLIKIVKIISITTFFYLLLVTIKFEVLKFSINIERQHLEAKTINFLHYFSIPIATLFPLLFIAGLVLLSKRTKRNTVFIFSFIVVIYYCINLCLLYYFVTRGFHFDPKLTFYHTKEAISILYHSQFLKLIIFPIIIFALAVSGIYEILATSSNLLKNYLSQKIYVLFVLCATLTSIFLFIKSDPETLDFFKNLFLNKSAAIYTYQDLFKKNIEKNANSHSPNDYYDRDNIKNNLFIVQLESVSALLISDKITPNFLTLQNYGGSLFPNIQSTSVMTIRAQESILCSVIPSIRESIASSNIDLDQLRCLPEVLKENGFKTLFFRSNDLEFANTGKFMKKIGFEEVHGEDIMKPDDPKYFWGYKEDIFYIRVFEYLEKYKENKLFVYIASGTTNHYPFYRRGAKEYENFEDRLPYTKPTNIAEKLSNSMFVQDFYFGQMYKDYFLPNFGSNTNLIVLGDHPWPIGIHENNVFNENNAWQENFVTSLAFVPPVEPGNSLKKGKIIRNLYGHMDLVPTIVEMYKLPQIYSIGKSFLPEINSETNQNSFHYPKHCLISTQPYVDGYISVIKYPIKYIFNFRKNTLQQYRLDLDPNETKPEISEEIDELTLKILYNCFDY